MTMGMLLLDGWFKLDPGEGAFYAVFGFIFVFVGIALLIGILTLLGIVMTKLGKRRERKENASAQREQVPSAPLPGKGIEADEGISPETVAAITAALAVCLQQERQKCEFVVRRIKKL